MHHRTADHSGVPADVLHQLGKGQQAAPLPMQTYAEDGQPQPTSPALLGSKRAATQWSTARAALTTVQGSAQRCSGLCWRQAGDTICWPPAPMYCAPD